MDRDDLAQLIAARLSGEQAALAARYHAPEGVTRHVAIDDLLPSDVAGQIATAFGAAAEHFTLRDSFCERKRTCAKLDLLDPLLKEASFALQHPTVLAEVAAIVEMAGLEPDASLYAGGLSRMAKGDFLNPHIDNSHDAARARYRRLNLLYYLTPGWSEQSGGNLELWDEAVRRPVTIVSRFNRLVLMETNRTSWHAVSPVRAGAARCCMSSYYFSPTSPDGSEYFHVTSFAARPDQPLRRIVARADAFARNFAGARLGLGRGKAQAYRT